ncbi:uncharacterized protein LOC143039137 [Oratosquilla oratoria]|uniref:uncharacterized protein LOC143039137 n=1 Tax=Oratosquilla oratoria TaxID=337810 RepID=UPI003F7634D4
MVNPGAMVTLLQRYEEQEVTPNETIAEEEEEDVDDSNSITPQPLSSFPLPSSQAQFASFRDRVQSMKDIGDLEWEADLRDHFENEEEMEDSEAVEEEDDGEFDEEPLTSRSKECCSRVQHFVSIGLDGHNEEIHVDVGMCIDKCPPISHRHHQPHLTHPLATFTRHQHRRRHHHHHLGTPSRSETHHATESRHKKEEITSLQNEKCVGEASECRAGALRREDHHTRTGRVTVDVVDSCVCAAVPRTCRRLQQPVTMFPDSPFETVLDVGTCSGRCPQATDEDDDDDEDGCRAVQNRTVSVEGPNGAVCTRVVESCGCVGHCHRVTVKESVFDHQDPSHPQVKDIDVGACEGSCQSVEEYRCVYRNETNPEECLISLRQPPRACLGVSHRTHTLVDAQGNERSIVSVEDCACVH